MTSIADGYKITQMPSDPSLQYSHAVDDQGVFEYRRGNTERVLHPNGPEGASWDSGVLINHNARGGEWMLNITSINGHTVQMLIDKYDMGSNQWIGLAGTAPLTNPHAAGAPSKVRVYPGQPTVAGADLNGVLPRRYRVRVTITGGTGAVTFSVGETLSL